MKTADLKGRIVGKGLTGWIFGSIMSRLSQIARLVCLHG